MNFCQVKDVVQYIRNCHRLLRDWLEAPRTRTNDAAKAKLLEGLRKDEQALQVALSRINGDKNASALNTYVQYAPYESLAETLKNIRIDPDMPIDEVVGRKQEFDEALIELLQQLKTSSSAPRVQELFETLLEYTESQVQNQSWAVRDPDDG